MFFIETKHCKEVISEYKTLFVSSQEGVIQRVCSDDIVMYEIVIPMLCIHGENVPDISMKIDDHVLKLFNTYEIVMITEEYIQGLSHGMCVSYYWEQSDALSWNTYYPPMSCVIKIPEWIINITEAYLEVDISDNKFSLTHGQHTYSFPILKHFQNAKGSILCEKLKEVFDNHKDNIAVIFFKENYPLCLEFTGSRRVYIAPPCQDSM